MMRTMAEDHSKILTKAKAHRCVCLAQSIWNFAGGIFQMAKRLLFFPSLAPNVAQLVVAPMSGMQSGPEAPIL